MDTIESNRIIDALGGTNAAAELCEVRAPAVSGWRNHGIPRARLMFIRLKRPDIFVEVQESVADGREQQN